MKRISDCGMVVIVGLVSLWLGTLLPGGQEPKESIPDVVRARAFELVDGKGNPVARIGSGGNLQGAAAAQALPGFGITIGENPTSVAWLNAIPNFGTMIGLNDPRGESLVRFFLSSDGEASIQLGQKATPTTAVFGQRADGSSYLHVKTLRALLEE